MFLVCYDLLVWHFLISVNILNKKHYKRDCGVFQFLPATVAQSVECLRQGIGGDTGSIPGYDTPKLLKWYSFGTPTYGVELGLVDPISG